MTATKTDRILTLHPAGKQGVRIAADKYHDMRRALLKVIPRRREGVAFQELAKAVRPHLDAHVFGPEASVTWYMVAVKQDLEARGEIQQVDGAKPQRLRRVPARERGGKA